jgi:hypothetical protein
MRVDDLTGAALDWAVFSIEQDARGWYINDNGCFMSEEGEISWEYQPSTDWRKGGPIIERERIKLWWDLTVYAPEHGIWFSQADPASHEMIGRTPLESAMRCYVLAKFGLHIDVPKELQ